MNSPAGHRDRELSLLLLGDRNSLRENALPEIHRVSPEGGINIAVSLGEKIRDAAALADSSDRFEGLVAAVLSRFDAEQPGQFARESSLKRPWEIFKSASPITSGDGLAALCYCMESCIEGADKGIAYQVLNGYLRRTDEYAAVENFNLFHAHEIIRNSLASFTAEGRSGLVQALERAQSLLNSGHASLVAVGGYSGSGKSGIGSFLEREGFIHLETDAVRKTLLKGDEAPVDGLYGAGTYSLESRTEVYDEVYKRADFAIKAGFPVVLDATFVRETQRDAAENLAGNLGVPFVGIWFEVPIDILKERVDRRMEHGGDLSDAGRKVLAGQLKEELGTVRWQKIDASRGIAEVTREALDLIHLQHS